MQQAHVRHSKYHPARGGHAPVHLRDAFCDAVNLYQAWKAGEPEPAVDLDGEGVPVSRVFGLLWCCSDILPGIVVDQVNELLPDGVMKTRTYAAAARALKGAMSVPA